MKEADSVHLAECEEGDSMWWVVSVQQEGSHDEDRAADDECVMSKSIYGHRVVAATLLPISFLAQNT